MMLVCLAKKFDKTFPEHKGIFKGNICDDGKQAEVLASKMVCCFQKLSQHIILCQYSFTTSFNDVCLFINMQEIIYSKWFCEGDIREAQAQMLTKKGDGLLTDWSQLRLGYRLGMCSILAMWVAWDCVWGQISKGEVSIGGRSAFPGEFCLFLVFYLEFYHHG